jgi:HEAT repeat protein
MDLAGAERLARTRHRWEIDEAGGLYVDHLERVVALIASRGGGECEQMAGWLHGIARTGLRPVDLAARRVPRRVIRIVDALAFRVADTVDSQARRIAACRGATLVLGAVAADECRPEALARLAPGMRQHRVGRYRDLLVRLGEPLGSELPGQAAGPRPSAGVDVMLGQLDSACPDRWEAVRALGSVGELRAARPLIGAYRAAKAGDGRWASGTADLAGALSRIAAQRRHQDDPQWVETLLGLAGDGDGFLRATAVRGLAGLAVGQPVVVRALSDDSPQVVSAALQALEPGQDRDLADELITITRQPGREWAWPRRLAARRLAVTGDSRAQEVLLSVLARDGMGLGRDLVTSLARPGDQAVVAQLIGQVRSRAPGRAAAAYLLGELGAREAVSDLIRMAGEETVSLQAVHACIEALGKIAHPAAVAALAAAARQKQASVRVAALLALSQIDDPAVGDVALAAAEDFEPDVREVAVRLLAARADQRATARLLSFCDGPLAAVALKGLIRLADPRAVRVLQRVFTTAPERRIRDLAGRALARSATNSAGLYLASWMDPGRLAATAWVLGEIGDKTAARRLAHFMTHRDERVRARVAAALGKIADPGTAPAIAVALHDVSPRVRASAATALGAVGATGTRDLLTPSLQDPHAAVRTAAAAALRRAGQGPG